MTPTQRTAALRLADYISADAWPGGLNAAKLDEAAALLRELAVVNQSLTTEPAQAPVGYTPSSAMAMLRTSIGPVAVWPYKTQCDNPVPVYASPPQRQPLSDVRAIVQQAALALEDLTALLGAM